MTGIKVVVTFLTFTMVCGQCETGDDTCRLEATGLTRHSLLQQSTAHGGQQGAGVPLPHSEQAPQLHDTSKMAHERLSDNAASLGEVLDKGHNRRLQTGTSDVGYLLFGVLTCLGLGLGVFMFWFFQHGGKLEQFTELPGQSPQRADRQANTSMHPSENLPADSEKETPSQPAEETPLLKGSGATVGAPEFTTKPLRALIPPSGCKVVTSTGSMIFHNGSQITYVDKKQHKSIVAFDPENVLGWLSMLRLEGTVFQMDSVLMMLVANFVLGGATVAFSARFPAITKKGFNTDVLDELLAFLMKFLAFMTGFFVNSCFNRWQNILSQFFKIFSSLKKIYMDMALHGVPREALHDVRRWGLLSISLISLEAPADWDPPNWDEEYVELSSKGMLNGEEKQALRAKVDGNKSSMVWLWIIMKLQECSIQGWIPPRTTPALVKILDLCHEATEAIDTIHELIIFQVPHQYMHMLSFLIHLFNIINTVRCGVVIGSVYETVYHSDSGRPTAMQVQVVLTRLCIMLLSPLIYQAFLCISLDISIPLGKGNTDLPVPFLLDRFAQEMDDMDACLRDPAAGSALPASRPGTYTGSKFPPSASPADRKSGDCEVS